MARRKAAEWVEIVAQWKRSRKTAAEFAAEIGVEVQSLRWWSWALRKRGAQQASPVTPDEPMPAFLPVRIVERAIPAKAVSALPGGPVEILVDDRLAVRVGPAFDEATLRRVLDLLRPAEVA